jgi:hypothetical protein
LSKGVKNTPTIVDGENKVEGLSEIEKYLLALEEKQNQESDRFLFYD